MRKHLFLFIILLIFVGATTLRAQRRGSFAPGFIIGEPTGIAWKYRLSERNSLDGALGLAPVDRFRMHVDYLWHSEPFNERKLSLYYGPGVAFGAGRSQYTIVNGRNAYFYDSRDVGFGVRGVIGLEYLIAKSPVELFLETAPILIMAPTGGFTLDVGFGVHFYL